jgi:hypothetical protein
MPHRDKKHTKFWSMLTNPAFRSIRKQLIRADRRHNHLLMNEERKHYYRLSYN